MRNTTQAFEAASQPVAMFTISLFAERGLSERYVADPTATVAELAAIRGQVDASAAGAASIIRLQANKYPDSYADFDKQITDFRSKLPAQRQRINTRVATAADVSEFFSAMTNNVTTSMNVNARSQPIAVAAVEQTVGVNLVRATDEFQDADGLAQASFVGDGLSDREYALFTKREGAYQARIAEILPLLPADERAQLQGLFGRPLWKQLMQLHADVIRNGPATRHVTANGTAANGTAANGNRRADTKTTTSAVQGQLPQPEIDLKAWTDDSAQAVQAITGVNIAQSKYANDLSGNEGSSQSRRSLLIGAMLLLLAVGVFLLTTWASNRLVRRLQNLRQATLTLSQERLPRIVERLREGEAVDVEAELPPLGFGSDEIGQVASAFEEAQRTAVTAAAREAETRAGLRTVFLDIAHRSQAIVYRQLKVLDQAERAQEDPDQLGLLFQLDHLATRSRRNAENLIILGGGQPGRQWRNPVPLMEIVRSAISEAEDYLRVGVGQVPRVDIAGALVADLIHLLAELVDNATSFSPPLSRVEVRGNVVGRGLVLEIEDQGLGVESQQLDELNRLLHEPPDFQVMALADEPRLGLFVVAQLSSRHGIRVTLTPSPAYGGTRVVVLLPTTALATGAEDTRAIGQRIAGPDAEQQRVLEQRALEQRAVELRAAREARGVTAARPVSGPLAPVSSATLPSPFPVSPSPQIPPPAQVSPPSGPFAPFPVPAPPAARGVPPVPVPMSPSSQGAQPPGPPGPVPPSPEALQPPSVQPLPVRPTATKPAATNPAATNPAATYPAASYPAATRPAVTRPATPQPVAPPEPAARREPFGWENAQFLGDSPANGPADRVIVLPEPVQPAPVPVRASPVGTVPDRGEPGGRPALPRRNPQTHLSPRLKSEPAPVPPESRSLPEPDAEQARSRMSALQRGTMRGRASDPEARR